MESEAPLQIAQDFALPLETVTSALGIFAVKGAGKSYTASVVTEEFVKRGLMVAVIDPLGVFWGIRSSADGERAGLPVLILGGKHGDLPLDPHSGKYLAQFLAEVRQPTILDLSLFQHANEQRVFVSELIEGFRHIDQPLMHLIIDEADLFAPQTPKSAAANQALDAVDTLVRRFRVKGLGTTLITQRPAVLNKDVMAMLDVLVVLRILSPQDTKAFDDWIKRYGTAEQRQTFLQSLPTLANGIAWFWSPLWLRTFRQVQIRRRETFDSSATPKVNVVARTPRQLAEIDLTLLKQQLDVQIQQALENDPASLRARIAELEQLLAHRSPANASSRPRSTHSAGDGTRQLAQLQEQNGRLQEENRQLRANLAQKETQLAQLRGQNGTAKKTHSRALPPRVHIGAIHPQIETATLAIQTLQASPQGADGTKAQRRGEAGAHDTSEVTGEQGQSPLRTEQQLLARIVKRVENLWPLEKRLLCWLLEHPDTAFTLTELSQKTGVSRSSLYENNLARLNALPFVTRGETPRSYSARLEAYRKANLTSYPDAQALYSQLWQAANEQ